MSRPWFEAESPSGLIVSPGPETEDDLLDAAFELAHFLHHDRGIARTICLEAMQRLEIAAAAQVKRLYYRPTRQNRFRASWGDRHLLQRLVYFHSEKWERLSETRDPASLTEEDLLLRFFKHLCQITMKRNSFYASIALGRIVHAYSTADTMEIYHAIAPEDCERKQSDYLRSRKAQLLDEVRTRFGGLLSIVRGPHQEDRIETREADPRRAAWSRECLRVLTPWAVACWGRPDGAASGRKRNRFAPAREESSAEARRFHALFDPPCFGRVARAARLADPSARLAIPRFQIGGQPPAGGDRGGEDRKAHLSPEERVEIQRLLAEESRRRREYPTRYLRILVDGSERARIDPRAARAARLSLEETAEMIEVRVCAPAGEVPLAVHALSEDPEGEPGETRVFSIELEAGQALSFRVEPAGSGDSREVEVDYRETSVLRSALLAMRRTAWQIGEAGKIAAARALQPAVLSLLLVAAGLWLAARRAPAPPPATGPLGAIRIPEKPKPQIAPPPPPSTAASSAPASAPSAETHVASARPPSRVPSRPVIAERADRETRAEPDLAGPAFSLNRAQLLETGPVPAAPGQDRAVAMSADSPLDAVRKSFLERLGDEEGAPAVHPSAAAATDGAMPIFARASGLNRQDLAIRNLRAAAYEAAVSASRPSLTIASPRIASRAEATSMRVPVIRPVGAAGMADGNCRQLEPSCGVARIAPAGARARER